MKHLKRWLRNLFNTPSIVTGNFLDRNERMKRITGC